MDSDQVIATLKRHEAELRSLGVEQIVLFGSVARDTGAEWSDVDVAVRLAPELRGLKRVGALAEVQALLSDLLHRRVDVVEEPARSPYIRHAIKRDGLRAF